MLEIRRVEAPADMHGNLPIVEAVVAAVVEERVDRIVIGGDVFLGQLRVESLQMLGQQSPFR